MLTGEGGDSREPPCLMLGFDKQTVEKLLVDALVAATDGAVEGCVQEPHKRVEVSFGDGVKICGELDVKPSTVGLIDESDSVLKAAENRYPFELFGFGSESKGRDISDNPSTGRSHTAGSGAGALRVVENPLRVVSCEDEPAVVLAEFGWRYA